MSIKFKQEHWVAMIISGFAEKKGLNIPDATDRLLNHEGMEYLEECYETLHQLSNDEVINDLIAITGENGEVS
ncbi:MAG: DUF3791 domain-containing protein [Candidatus Ancillula sp.]|jgi:hypothetical protein|nr:DUF3791 domain-containing protein [Candidatus Ancillula sp.]